MEKKLIKSYRGKIINFKVFDKSLLNSLNLSI